VGVAKHGQMLGDGSKGAVELVGDLRCGELAIPDQAQDAASGRLGDGLQWIHAAILATLEIGAE
jgi:hypothetical protein